MDWKDGRFWPTVLPIMLSPLWRPPNISFGSISGAVRRAVRLSRSAYGRMDRTATSASGLTFFPIGLCWPTSIIPMALYMTSCFC